MTGLSIIADRVRLSYGRTPALSGVDIDIEPGAALGIVGPSGCGKSSLLYCLAGLEVPTSGQVLWGDQDTAALCQSARSAWRLQHAGFVFQSAELLPELTLAQNVELPLDLLGWSRRERERRAGDLLDWLGLAACASRKPAAVSGGQLQRAAVARAVVHHPEVLFADEPTGALDSENRELVVELLVDLAREEGASLVMVTHDPSTLVDMDAVATMRDGRIVAIDLP